MIIAMPNGRATAEPPSANFMSDFNYYADFEKDLLQDLIPYISLLLTRKVILEINSSTLWAPEIHCFVVLMFPGYNLANAKTF